MADLTFRPSLEVVIGTDSWTYNKAAQIEVDKADRQLFKLTDSFKVLYDFETGLYDRYKLLIIKNNDAVENLYIDLLYINGNVIRETVEPGGFFISTSSTVNVNASGDSDIQRISAAFPAAIVGEAELFMATLDPIV